MNPNPNRTQWPALGLAMLAAFTSGLQPLATAPTPYLLNDPVDVSVDFQNFANTLFLADKLTSFGLPMVRALFVELLFRAEILFGNRSNATDHAATRLDVE